MFESAKRWEEIFVLTTEGMGAALAKAASKMKAGVSLVNCMSVWKELDLLNLILKKVRKLDQPMKERRKIKRNRESQVAGR